MSSPVELFGLATRGVNVVEAPTHLSVEEVTAAQNVEVVSDAGENALDQRPGMLKVNAVALSGSVVMAQDVPSSMLTDKTATLYVGMHTSATHNWRKSTDGTTWTNDDTPAKVFRDAGAVSTYYKSFGRAVSIKGKMYFPGGYNGSTTTPVVLHQYDGVTDRVVSTVPPAVSGATLNTPTAPTISTGGTAGATAYSYKIVAITGAPHSAASSAGATAVGNASLTGDNYNILTLSTPGSGVTSYDIYRTVGGATQGKIGSVPVVAGSLTNSNGSPVALPVPSAPSISTFPAGTTYTYLVVAHNGSAVSARSTGTTIANGPTTLNGSTYNAIFPTTTYSVTPWTTMDVYRTVGGATQGKIGVITYPATSLNDTGLVGDGTTAPAASSGTAPYSTVYPTGASTVNFVDAGLTGDATTAPTTATAGTAGDALAVLDLITDGTSLYMAVLDLAGADPVVYGRILRYSPASNAWTQMGAFPLALGNGCAGVMAFYGGTLSYATYAGLTAANTTYANNVGSPLPAGGVQETHTFTASMVPTSMAVFNGDLYVGVTYLTATASIIAKRVAGATWSTSFTANTTPTVGNGFTALGVFNGRLFAGFHFGSAADGARVYSTPDGVNWTFELYTGANSAVPNQMTIFNNKLYVAMTGFGGNSFTYQRDVQGTWTQVDSQSDSMTGAIAVVYV